jgi:hypothetical protein
VLDPSNLCEVCKNGFVANPARDVCVDTSVNTSYCNTRTGGIAIIEGSLNVSPGNNFDYKTCNNCQVNNCKNFENVKLKIRR